MRPLALALALLVFAACGGDAQEGEGTGVVRAIGLGGKTVTLEHGEIPGLMQPMTMEFEVLKPSQLDDLAVGDSVAFTLRYADGAYTVTDLAKTSP